MKKISICIADDHELIREGLIRLLSDFEELDVRFAVANGAELMERLNEATLTDVILLDIDMPVKNGVDTLKEIRKKYGNKTKVLGLSIHEEYYIVQNFLLLGANGFISKANNATDILKAIQTVVDIDFYLSPTISKILFTNSKYKQDLEDKPLNVVEKDIIKLVCQQKNNKQIGAQLKLSPNTVSAYRTKILEKTDTINAAGLAIFAVRYGIYRL
jgi:DNA-binding NarL/FixJ family response regulator